MVTGEVLVRSLGDVADVQEQNRNCEGDGKDTSGLWLALGTRVSSLISRLIHPTELTFGGNWRTENNDLCNAFRSAVLSEHPIGTTIDQIDFEDISLGLLMVLFTTYGKTMATRDAGAVIIRQNRCFLGSTYTADNEGGRKLHGYYSCKIFAAVLKAKKALWRANKPGATKDILEYLTQSLFDADETRTERSKASTQTSGITTPRLPTPQKLSVQLDEVQFADDDESGVEVAVTEASGEPGVQSAPPSLVCTPQVVINVLRSLFGKACLASAVRLA